MKPKLLLLGHARHGKDTVAEILRDDYKFKLEPSSMAISEYIRKNFLQSQNYSTNLECYEDRVNHRPAWFDAIAHYNKDDPCAWAKYILSMGDIYCGMRRLEEFDECITQKLFDYVIWVDALERHPPEPVSSFTIPQHRADLVIDNNGTLDQLYENIDSCMKEINVYK